MDGFAANAANHELSILFGRDKTGEPQLFEVERNGRTKLVASGDMATDFANGCALNLMDFSGFFDCHRAGSFA